MRLGAGRVGQEFIRRKNRDLTVGGGRFRRHADSVLNHELGESPLHEHKGCLAARIIFALGRRDAPPWSVDDVVGFAHPKLAELYGEWQVAFVVLRGMFALDRASLPKDGVQLIVFDASRKRVFKRQMIGLAEVVAGQVAHRRVVVDLQRNGLRYGLFCVVPP